MGLERGKRWDKPTTGNFGPELTYFISAQACISARSSSLSPSGRQTPVTTAGAWGLWRRWLLLSWSTEENLRLSLQTDNIYVMADFEFLPILNESKSAADHISFKIGHNIFSWTRASFCGYKILLLKLNFKASCRRSIILHQVQMLVFILCLHL